MSDIRFNRWLHQSGTGGIYQDSAGNIGIGTSVPTSALDIQSGQIQVGTAVTIHSSGFQVGGSNLHSTGLTVQNLNSIGVITATSFSGNVTGNVTGNATGLSGTPDIVVGSITATTYNGIPATSDWRDASLF